MPSPSKQRDSVLKKWVAKNPTLAMGVAGSLLFWLALPPLNWAPLAWIAPVPWLYLICGERLEGARPYRALWVAGILFWLLAVHWIRLPHSLNYLAWVALATYLGGYLPVFVGLARVGVHRWGLPLVVVTPVVWTGLDWFRGHLLTGFLMGSLAHTQYRVPTMIQIADIAGEYGVTFLIMFVASCITTVLFNLRLSPELRNPWIRGVVPTLLGLLAVIFAVVYGANSRNAARQHNEGDRGPRIALIQGNTPADWKMDAERQQQIMQEYLQLSFDAVRMSREQDGREVDLVVWPETAFRQTLITAAEGFTPPPERVHASMLTAAQKDLAELVRQVGCAVLVGLDRIVVVPDKDEGMAYHAYNGAALVNREEKIVATYDKMHRVPFGEFIPFAQWFPALYKLTPLTGGIAAGTAPGNMELEGETFISPNICYETVVPHLIRWQWNYFFGGSIRPDALINLTNDAWFWGSSELDMHLACGVFRAVETRTPLLIAANGGLSAHVDRLGNIRQVSPRQETAVLLVDLMKEGHMGSSYMTYGDWLAGLCVVCCVVLAIAAVWSGKRPSGDALHRG